MAKVPQSLADHLASPLPPSGFLDWYSEAEVRAALNCGVVGSHEKLIRAWLRDKDKHREHLERAATCATVAHRKYYVAMWATILVPPPLY